MQNGLFALTLPTHRAFDGCTCAVRLEFVRAPYKSKPESDLVPQQHLWPWCLAYNTAAVNRDCGQAVAKRIPPAPADGFQILRRTNWVRRPANPARADQKP